jgi:hypothetical protein
MQRFFVWVTSLMLVALGVAVGAQGKVATAEEHAAVMKANAGAAGPMFKAIGSGAFADARTQVAVLRKNYMAIQAFYTDKKKDDAVAIVKDGLTKLDALDKMLAAPAPDQMAAQAAAKEFQGTCGACHKLYRDGDGKATPYTFKPGVL